MTGPTLPIRAAVCLALSVPLASTGITAAAAAPVVASITPAAAVGSVLEITIVGEGFDPGSTVAVESAGGQIAARGAVSDRKATRLVASLPLAGAPPGRYVVKVLNPDGARAQGTLTLSSEVSVSPASGPPGTVFTYTGRGFKGGFGVTSHLEGPDGNEWQAKRFPTTAAGTFEHAITSAEFAPGTYTVWALDDYTKTPAARVTFQVTARR
jgi:hypothetical protein